MASCPSDGGGGFGSGAVVRLRILAASSGTCYPISLLPNELSVATIRSRLAAALPINDQILLLGPPYKVPKDSLLRTNETLAALRLGDEEDEYFNNRTALTAEKSSSNDRDSSDQRQNLSILGPTERTGSKRLFLFSKRALSEGAPDPPVCVIDPSPGPLPLPSQSDMPSPPPALPPEMKITPLRMALEVYERQFMYDMAKGRAFADGADLRLAACRKCVSEQAVIAQALRAAVSNLADHRASAARERAQFGSDYMDILSSHTALLRQFDARVAWKGNVGGGGDGGVSTVVVAGCGKNESLGNITLHPALVSAARSAGRVMESLLDAVPLDREKAWAAKCRTAHERLATSFHELDSAFGTALGTSASWNEEVRGDMLAEAAIKALYDEVENVGIQIRNAQSEKLAILTSNHTEATRIVSNAVKNEVEKGEKGVGANSAFPALEDMSQSSSSILPCMESDDAILAELSQRVADAKTDAMKRMRTRLRQISIAQSAIARANSSVAVLRHALAQQKVDMEHLEHVVELPTSYRDFLSEIRRRRAYCAAFTSNATALLDRLNAMRSDEVKLRETFLRGPGRHLMPAFFEIFAPTLATSPPIFAPQLPEMIEFDTLPDLGDDSAHCGSSSLESGNIDNAPEDARVSSASTLTECPSLRQASSTGNRNDMDLDNTSKKAAIPDHQPDRNNGSGNRSTPENPSLIVSADDNSGNDVIMETVCQEDSATRAIEENADCTTLMYENEILRQALERAGVQRPRSYLDSKKSSLVSTSLQKSLEEKIKEKTDTISSLETKLDELQRELEKAKGEAEKSKLAETNAKKITSEKVCDKISHTSFFVGDVGLFMPTGRGRGGKRIYLAFHSGCPHRYLSPDCVSGTPDFVLGRIVYQEELVAGAMDTDDNPFGLHVGTKFWVLTVETLKKV